VIDAFFMPPRKPKLPKQKSPKSGNPWDIPYAKKFKRGDKTPEQIFLAVGRALTKWEGVEVSLGSIFTALIGSVDVPGSYIPAVRAFGAVINSSTRSEMILQAAEAFFYEFEGEGFYDEVQPYRAELKKIMLAYTGWISRRNDLAHGYVTENKMPDYEIDEAPLTSFYLLCPSHGNTKKWPLDWEPTYKYKGEDIENFAREFEDLDNRIEDFSRRLTEWRKLTRAKFPPR
jgi:hypothetical protein